MPPDATKTANINLKVTEDERWAFKELCVKHRMSQVDGFRLAVRLLEEHLERAPDRPDPSPTKHAKVNE